MKRIICISALLIFLLPLFSEIKNRDEPERGDYTFAIKKIWQVDGAGDEFFVKLWQVAVDDEGTVFCHDNRNFKFYIFDKNGKHIKSFGTKGEGPGEIRDITEAGLHLSGDKVIIEDAGKLHYFSKQGDFIKSVANNNSTRRPVFFLNENEFISAPQNVLGVADGKAKIRLINLKTNEEKLICEFSIFEGGGVIRRGNNQAAVVSVALTPMMIIGHDKSRLFYGMNDQYQITINTIDGKPLNTFSLNRQRKKISEKSIRDRFIREAKDRAPIALIEQLAKTLPNILTHYAAIEVHNGLTYVFMSYWERANSQQIDIFSPEGKYLYRGFIKVDQGLSIRLNTVISGKYLYLVLENEDGDMSLCKYSITLPGF